MDIVFEKGLTKQQEEEVMIAAYLDKQDKIAQAHRHPIWGEIKSVVGHMKKDILLSYKREIAKG